jgi:hypothetical protein
MHDGAVLLGIGVLELLLLASLSAVVFRHIGFPYTIGLVLVGVLLALVEGRLGALEPAPPTSSTASGARLPHGSTPAAL